jgi:hypothetical protein
VQRPSDGERPHHALESCVSCSKTEAGFGVSGGLVNQQDRTALDRLIRGFQISRMIRLVADLTLADRIAPEETRVVGDLAAECKVNATPLLRILRALASFGIFRVTASGEISHSPLSLLLRTDTPGSLHHGARFWTAHGSWRAWGELDAALVDGIPHQAAWNMGRFDYLRQHPNEARIFDEFMAHFPDDRHQAVADAYDFSSAELIADIGGGNGEALRHILCRFAGPRGLVFDRDDVVAAIPDAARNRSIRVRSPTRRQRKAKGHASPDTRTSIPRSAGPMSGCRPPRPSVSSRGSLTTIYSVSTKSMRPYRATSGFTAMSDS